MGCSVAEALNQDSMHWYALYRWKKSMLRSASSGSSRWRYSLLPSRLVGDQWFGLAVGRVFAREISEDEEQG